jgi:arylsulfatase A-like enzyme
MITPIDDCIGKILDSTTQNELIDDTIIVFLADHGESLSSTYRLRLASGRTGRGSLP